jgi:hypothetical protein
MPVSFQPLSLAVVPTLLFHGTAAWVAVVDTPHFARADATVRLAITAAR